MRKIILSLILILLFSANSNAQKEGNIWYFGHFAGVNFNTPVPSMLGNSKMDTNEGCASVADKNGNLLFYTDGVTIYNKNHAVMDNGGNLSGNPSSTQSAVIIPHPADKNQYFVFTVAAEVGPLKYSIVDITRQSGLGGVTAKNVSLLERSTEKITAVKNADNTGIWVIGHEFGSDKFYAFLVNADGIEGNPVISAVGSPMEGLASNSIGYLKFSSKGTRLATAVTGASNFVELYDFDRSTGVVSNAVMLRDPISLSARGPYGLEFSPNEKYLYISGGLFSAYSSLYQVKLEPDRNNTITKSTLIDTGLIFGALQSAPDGKIYLAQKESHYLHAIEKPDGEGLNCQFKKNVLYLNKTRADIGLPTFNQSLFSEFNFVTEGNCISQITSFSLRNSLNPDSILWDFGDAASGINNTSKQLSPFHQYNQTGTYKVKVTSYTNGEASAYSGDVIIYGELGVNLGKDTTLQYGQTLILDSGNPQGTNIWSDGKTTPTNTITEPGSYSVQVFNEGGCTDADTINVMYDQLLNFRRLRDTSVCYGQYIDLAINITGATYKWSTGETTPAITVSQPGQYWVEITNAYNTRVARDTVIIMPCTPLPVTVTNTFTPNGDGINDLWVVKNVQTYPVNMINIFNRNGTLLRTFRQYGNNWDGTINGRPLPAGVYYYTISLNDLPPLSGYITIIR